VIKRGRPVIFFLFLFLSFSLSANETKDGYIRMLINEKTGRFSLSFLTDPEKSTYSDLIYRDGRTSFFDISIDGVPYRLGESRFFTTLTDRENDEPVVKYTSEYITVKTSFTPVKTVSSPNANGIRITIQIINTGEEEPEVGLRLIIDTVLGEGRKNIPFITDNLSIKKEKIIESSSDEKYWISRSKDISLMGSIADPLDDNAVKPDFLHFANWKKLSDVPWKASYHEGRSFNKLPYSVGDCAVAYYWNPVVLEMGRVLTYTVYLTTEDTAWYQQPKYYAAPVKPTPKPAPVIEEKPAEIPAVVSAAEEAQLPAPEINIAVIEKEAHETSQKTGEDKDIVALRLMQNVLNRFIGGEISLSEIDLQKIENAVENYGQKQQ